MKRLLYILNDYSNYSDLAEPQARLPFGGSRRFGRGPEGAGLVLFEAVDILQRPAFRRSGLVEIECEAILSALFPSGEKRQFFPWHMVTSLN
jgi:hypothetical protein